MSSFATAMDVDSPRAPPPLLPPASSEVVVESCIGSLNFDSFFSRPDLYKRPTFLQRQNTAASIISDIGGDASAQSALHDTDEEPTRRRRLPLADVSPQCGSPKMTTGLFAPAGSSMEEECDQMLDKVALRLSKSCKMEQEDDCMWSMDDHEDTRSPMPIAVAAEMENLPANIKPAQALPVPVPLSRATPRKTTSSAEKTRPKITHYFSSNEVSNGAIPCTQPARPVCPVRASTTSTLPGSSGIPRPSRIDFNVAKPNAWRPKPKRKSNDISQSPAVPPRQGQTYDDQSAPAFTKFDLQQPLTKKSLSSWLYQKPSSQPIKPTRLFTRQKRRSLPEQDTPTLARRHTSNNMSSNESTPRSSPKGTPSHTSFTSRIPRPPVGIDITIENIDDLEDPAGDDDDMDSADLLGVDHPIHCDPLSPTRNVVSISRRKYTRAATAPSISQLCASPNLSPIQLFPSLDSDDMPIPMSTSKHENPKYTCPIADIQEGELLAATSSLLRPTTASSYQFAIPVNHGPRPLSTTTPTPTSGTPLMNLPMRTPSPCGARRCAATPVDVPSRRGALMRPSSLSLIKSGDLAASPDSLQIITALSCGYGTGVFKQPDRNPFL
ncbi:hypothetical protein DFS34DRAFT_88302 [Phlyctochytrium arcticum]|nr:hypothetical protein DFS34DRAFT_88302 [Phlyctochytrium arcticum]